MAVSRPSRRFPRPGALDVWCERHWVERCEHLFNTRPGLCSARAREQCLDEKGVWAARPLNLPRHAGILGTMAEVSGAGSIAARYQGFAAWEARGASSTYETWANSAACDEAVLARLQELPTPKQQPNLVFAAARHHGARSSYETFRSVLLDSWADVRGTILSRSTQTNEAARCAMLLPFLAALPQPLALIEVGASAGLCLLPDQFSYRYTGGVALDPVGGRSPVVLTAELGAGASVPSQLPQIAWRAGIDLAPIDVTDP